jgi:hypothetical protein
MRKRSIGKYVDRLMDDFTVLRKSAIFVPQKFEIFYLDFWKSKQLVIELT